ncbi:MAG: DUF72 domain-containing protein [Candidatus Aminicenantes bacterium]|nr:MAG: DUF72 domain-containing protein [Candidatus Aminicenantes bacterium]
MKVTIPEDYKPYLKIGTCSWKFDSWKGLFYDADKSYRPDDYLADYARHLRSVEIDQWFWSLFPGGIKLPDIGTVKTYADSVPEDFLFTVKAPNSLTLTHFYAKQPKKYAQYAGQANEHFLDNELLEKFLERLTLIERKLGPIMFQFEYLNKKKMPTKEMFFDKFHEFIIKAPKGYRYAIEIRNPNYLSPAFFRFLKDHDLGYVYLEGYYMPHIGEVYEKFQPATADFCIVRLHGGDRLEIETQTGGLWNRVISPKPEGLKAAAQIVRTNRRQNIVTFVNLNNHFEGSAPISAERFISALAESET